MESKPKLSVYWAASCGGCEIAVTNLHEKILDVDANFDFMFCPCLIDTKKSDIEALDDNEIAITLFNGAIRTSENEEMANLLRKKSQTFIAFGACSFEGCIPGLANLTTKEDIFDTCYFSSPSTVNEEKVIPNTYTKVPEGELELPEYYERVKPLKEVVDVDYFIPGCPPEPKQIWDVIEFVLSGEPLPPKGSILGAGNSSVCEECTKIKEEKKISKFYRTYEIIPDTEKCLLEQGIVCMGIATRSGCEALCPKVNMPCIGCYGPPEGVSDQGAKMISALGSVIDIGESQNLSESKIPAHIDEIISTIPDLAGTFYKSSLANSLLKGKKS